MSAGKEALAAVGRITASVRQLEQLYPGRRFTLDGHLVGSLGEVLAAELYGIHLSTASERCHDGTCPSGRRVQIKLTQTSRVSMYEKPDYLIVLQLRSDGTVAEVYNGPGAVAWKSSGPLQKNGQRSVSISTLRSLASTVDEGDVLPVLTDVPWFSRSVHGAPGQGT
jgi:hypothetical protein